MTNEEIQAIRQQYKYDPTTLKTGLESSVPSVDSRLAFFRGEAVTSSTKKTKDSTGILGKTQAFAGGFAEATGATLGAEAVNYLGTKAVENAPTFGSPTLENAKKKGLENLANAGPLDEQFNDVTHQTENPMTAIAGNVVGTPAGFVGGAPAKVIEAGTKIVGAVKSIPVIATKIEKNARAKTEKFIKTLITPALSAKDTAAAIKTGKVLEAGATGDRDLSLAIPGFENIVKAVSGVKGVSPKNTLLKNVNAIHDGIGEVATNLKTQLKGKGMFTPDEFDSYLSVVKNDLIENPTLVGDAEKTATKILDKFTKLVQEKGYHGEGLLDARQALDKWMSSQKGNVFNPNTDNAVSTAMRAIRQGGNNFLAEKVPEVAVKELLATQARLFDAIENIAPKAAKEGSNGLKRWIKAHPNTVNAAKYLVPGASVLGGASILND